MTRITAGRRRLVAFLLTLSIVFVSFGSLVAPAQQRGRRPLAEATQSRPRLVLLIVVDQFRYDYLERYSDLFVGNGLRRLLQDGASWVDTNYDHMPTYTAPGHATFMTGAYPAETGIVANEWPDRETGKKVSSVSDDNAKLFAGGANEQGVVDSLDLDATDLVPWHRSPRLSIRRVHGHGFR